MANAYSLAEIVRTLNRSPAYVSDLQKPFGLPSGVS